MLEDLASIHQEVMATTPNLVNYPGLKAGAFKKLISLCLPASALRN